MMLIPRINQEAIFKSFETRLVTALLGPRRVGKSTLVELYIKAHAEKKWVLLNMDLRPERLRVEKDELKLLIEEKALQALEPKKPIHVFIEEAQKCPALFDQIKFLYDHFKGTKAVKFILTGSGFLSLHQKVSETLAGRIELFYLNEFNLRETALLDKKFPEDAPSVIEALLKGASIKKLQKMVNDLSPFRPLLEKCLSTELVWGGLPEVLLTSTKEQKLTYLANYLQTYLEKDIRDIGTIADLNTYQKMMEVLAAQTGSLHDDQKILQSLGASRDTLKKYRGFLEATLFYREIYPYIDSVLRRLVKSPKGYLTNNGLISYLTGFDELPLLEKTGMVGARFENWILKEWSIALSRHTGRSHIYFWRTSGDVEVDFLVEKKPFLLPCEATYTEHEDSKKFKHLKLFMEGEKKTKRGLCIYNGPFQYYSKNKILFLPAWCLV